MKKKKILSVLMCGVMCGALGACGTGTPESSHRPGKAALPDYDLKEEELAVKIAGWVIPKELSDTQIGYIKDCGISVLQAASAGNGTLTIDVSSELSEENKRIMSECEQNGLSMLLHLSGKDDSKIGAVSNVADYGAVMGLCYDEPSKEQIDKIAARVAGFNETAGNKSLFVNLYPSLAATVSIDFSGDYKAYLDYYCTNVLEKLTAGEKWLSADRYPLTYDGKGQPCLDTGWLADVEAVALTARKYEGVKTNFFIQTMPYGGEANSGAQAGSRDRVPTYEDVRLQEYTLMSFGYDMISCFCYATPAVGGEFTEEQVAMIDREGNRTPVYYAVQKSNREILAFDHVIGQFDWKGVFTNDAGATTSGRDRTKNSSFSNLTERMSIESIDCLAEVTSSADTLFGYFMDAEDNAGFTVVNYNDTSAGLSDLVTLKFNGDYGFNKALCYIGGEKTIVEVQSDSLSLELGVGEGVFVIPYYEA